MLVSGPAAFLGLKVAHHSTPLPSLEVVWVCDCGGRGERGGMGDQGMSMCVCDCDGRGGRGREGWERERMRGEVGRDRVRDEAEVILCHTPTPSRSPFLPLFTSSSLSPSYHSLTSSSVWVCMGGCMGVR